MNEKEWWLADLERERYGKDDYEDMFYGLGRDWENDCDDEDVDADFYDDDSYYDDDLY